MKVQSVKTEFRLNNGDIENITRQVTAFMEQLETEKKNRLRIALSVEEALLRFQERLGQGARGILVTGRLLGRPYISLSVDGEAYNPFELYDAESNGLGHYGNHLLENLGVAPVYSRDTGSNRLIFKLRKQSMNPILQLAIAAAAAILIGFLGLQLPGNLAGSIESTLITPLCDAFFNVLGTMAGPVTFLSITWGIFGISDAALFGKIGKNMILHFLGMITLISVIMCLAVLPFFTLEYSSGGSGSSQASAIISMLLGFFPPDIFSPFIEGNFMQIVLMAIVTGVALLVLNRQTHIIAGAIEQLNSLTQYIMEYVGRGIPFLVFLILLQLIWSDSLSVITGALKPIVLIAAAGFIASALLILAASAIFRTSPALLLKKTSKTFILAASTASSAAAFSTCVSTCEDKLGIQNRLPKFGVPIGISLFPIGNAATYIIICLYMAETYQVQCSPLWIVLLVFTCLILSIATPPVPGGAIACYTIMFLQLGIPAEALGIALALDVVLDFIVTGVNVFCLQYEIAFQARKLKLIDIEILRKK